MTLSIEPVNRSETFFLRTAKEAESLCEAVGHPRIGVTIDTFHANIEEKNIANGVYLLGPLLKRVHASENDRGVLGERMPRNALIDSEAFEDRKNSFSHHALPPNRPLAICARTGNDPVPGCRKLSLALLFLEHLGQQASSLADQHDIANRTQGGKCCVCLH